MGLRDWLRESQWPEAPGVHGFPDGRSHVHKFLFEVGNRGLVIVSVDLGSARLMYNLLGTLGHELVENCPRRHLLDQLLQINGW
jgi:hypothetical protein